MNTRDKIKTMTISIHPMTIDDYASVRQVDILTQKQYLGKKFDDLNSEEQDAHLVSRKTEFQQNVDTGYCFVAKDGDTIIGFLLSYETLPFRGALYIRYIGLHPAYQNKGIGLLLYEKLIEKAKQNHIKEIKAFINLDNPTSIKFHEKAGFTLCDRKEATLTF